MDDTVDGDIVSIVYIVDSSLAIYYNWLMKLQYFPYFKGEENVCLSVNLNHTPNKIGMMYKVILVL